MARGSVWVHGPERSVYSTAGEPAQLHQNHELATAAVELWQHTNIAHSALSASACRTLTSTRLPMLCSRWPRIGNRASGATRICIFTAQQGWGSTRHGPSSV